MNRVIHLGGGGFNLKAAESICQRARSDGRDSVIVAMCTVVSGLLTVCSQMRVNSASILAVPLLGSSDRYSGGSLTVQWTDLYIDLFSCIRQASIFAVGYSR